MVVVMLLWSRREDSGSHAAGCMVTTASTRATPQPKLAFGSHGCQQWPSCCGQVLVAANVVNLGISDWMTALHSAMLGRSRSTRGAPT